MVDLAAALADNSRLIPFEGEDVLQAGIEIPGAAGGLREAMKIEPQQFHAGDELFVVLRTTVGKIRFDPILSEGERLGWRRVHVLVADEATFIDGDQVTAALEEQRRKIQRAKDAAAGQGRLPTDEELLEAHAEGAHTELVDGCVECDREKEAVEAEKPPDPTPLAGRKPRGRTRKSAE